MRLPDRNRLTSRRSPHTSPHETFRRQAQRRHPRVPEKSAPLAANARFLKRAQRIQRRLLCLGETPDARDSEPLVESIPPQRLLQLATLEVPEPDGPVIPATGQPAAIGTHLHRVHPPPMSLLHAHARPAPRSPPAQPSITAASVQQIPIGNPAQRRDHP